MFVLHFLAQLFLSTVVYKAHVHASLECFFIFAPLENAGLDTDPRQSRAFRTFWR